MKLLNLLLVVLSVKALAQIEGYTNFSNLTAGKRISEMDEVKEGFVDNATDDNVTDENITDEFDVTNENITDEFDEDVTNENVTDEHEDQKPESDLKLRSSLIDRRLGCFQGVACRMLRPTYFEDCLTMAMLSWLKHVSTSSCSELLIFTMGIP